MNKHNLDFLRRGDRAYGGTEQGRYAQHPQALVSADNPFAGLYFFCSDNSTDTQANVAIAQGLVVLTLPPIVGNTGIYASELLDSDVYVTASNEDVYDGDSLYVKLNYGVDGGVNRTDFDWRCPLITGGAPASDWADLTDSNSDTIAVKVAGVHEVSGALSLYTTDNVAVTYHVAASQPANTRQYSYIKIADFAVDGDNRLTITQRHLGALIVAQPASWWAYGAGGS